MRGVLLMMLAVVACGKDKGEAIRIGSNTPAVGDVVTTHQDNLWQAMVSTPRGQVELIYRMLADQKVEVMEVDGAGKVTRGKVTYVSESHAITGLNETEQTSPATTGHSYLLWREGGAVRAARDDGSAMSDEEQALVVADNLDFDVPDRVQQAIRSRAWHRGERVSLPAAELGGARVRATRITSLALILRRVDDGIAQFEMHIELAGRNGSDDNSSKIDGVMKVDTANGRVLEIAGGGAVQGHMMGMPFSGHATILMEQR